ncbi:14037_t:CDS:2 [Ambispora leptoticha]|uniref:14037_t:CDS:1 n=1 Tax=Ambispora leptoticha TaxID=144679 RepID=A0A9N8ZJ65_9GLOM|nr:14037_t:CDS:2 [Ambispora leptoticha]
MSSFSPVLNSHLSPKGTQFPFFSSEKQDEADIEDLRRELRRLIKKREELTLTLDNEEKNIPPHVSDNLMNRKEENALSRKESDANNKARQLFQQKASDRLKIEELLQAYHMTGKTIFQDKKNRVGLRFETFFKGKILEPYYIFVENELNTEKLIVAKHTIPSFIPLKELETAYLNDNMDKFLEIVDDYLQAYVTRREEFSLVHKILGKRNDNNDFVSNNACSFFEFRVQTAQGINIKVTLTYGELKSAIPSNVVVHNVSSKELIKSRNYIVRMRQIENEFKKRNLIEVFDLYFLNNA